MAEISLQDLKKKQAIADGTTDTAALALQVKNEMEKKEEVSRPHVALRSSASDNRLLRLYQNGSKTPENQGFPGFSYAQNR